MSNLVAAKRFAAGLTFELVHGDLTEQQVDAIVNAANRYLEHGGGVAAVIARKGGSVIQRQSREWIQQHGIISHGTPALTDGGDLPCQYVIHVVGPRWGEGEEANKLKQAVMTALELATERRLSSLALPPISTGIFGYPKDKAAEVILDAVSQFAESQGKSSLQLVRLTIIDRATLTPFQRAFDKRWPSPPSE